MDTIIKTGDNELTITPPPAVPVGVVVTLDELNAANAANTIQRDSLVESIKPIQAQVDELNASIADRNAKINLIATLKVGDAAPVK